MIGSIYFSFPRFSLVVSIISLLSILCRRYLSRLILVLKMFQSNCVKQADVDSLPDWLTQKPQNDLFRSILLSIYDWRHDVHLPNVLYMVNHL